jgi:DNA-binding PadR family transcriptional regulator
MVNTSYRSPWALTIMSLLHERPMHPYEIRRKVRYRGKGEFVDLRPGSLYRTIERLEKARLIEPVETTREGKFPERTVYRLTEQGLEELEDWMRELLSTPAKDFPQFTQAMSVLAILDQVDAQLQLGARVLRLEGEIAAVESMMHRLAGALPRLFQLETEYVLALRRAELAWVAGVAADLRTGRLGWTREQLRRDWGDDREDRPLDMGQDCDEPGAAEMR